LERVARVRRELLAGFAFGMLYVVVDASHWLTLSRAVRTHRPAMAIVGVSALEAICWLLCTPFIFALVRRLPVMRARRSARAVVLIIVGLPLALAISYLNLRLRVSSEFLPRDVDVREAKLFAMWFGFISAAGVYTAIVVAAMVRDYVRHTQADREHAARLETQLALAQLESLRHQLDPHFLFNTLNLISALAEDDPRGVRRMISRLSELLRFSLEGAQKAEITVREELALLDRYLDIMRMRFQGRLKIDVNADDSTLSALVPSLVLQPLAENAVRHGVEKVRGLGRLVIETALEQDMIVLRVRDNGPGAPPESGRRAFVGSTSAGERSGGLGLRNTVARLDQLYGTAARFTLRPDPRGGTVAEVRIPYHSNTELRVTGVSIEMETHDAT
jgi:sensor histidine kinase YesM